MSIEVAPGTPLAEALNSAILPKLVEAGWGTGGDEDGALAEYIILMLVNGKTQEQIAHELSSELLSLPPDDPAVLAFSQWLFETLAQLHSQMNGAQAPQGDAPASEMDTDMGALEGSELNAPTGPRSMRNGGPRGGRDKRLLGHVNKAMDRTGDAALHRVRGQTGNERIGRTPPAGPRGGPGRGGRHNNNNRAASLQAGLANMGAQGQGWMMGAQPPNNMELVAMLEQQNQMMFQLSQQLMQNNGGQRGRGGKSLFERTQNPNQRGNQRRGGHHNHAPRNQGENGEANGEDMDMGGSRPDPPNPDEAVCKYNLRCTNKECKFAHQSPAAPPGTNVDVTDVCSFGAACKNRKCTGRHPSPATKLAHQSEQDCKFWPNCQNYNCPFKHPSAPPCRNGANCTDANCKFTHVKVKCKFNPCKNARCPFMHDEGQQGGFKDKVWTPGGDGEHVSQRSFVDENAPVENVTAEDDSMKPEQGMQEADVIG